MLEFLIETTGEVNVASMLEFIETTGEVNVASMLEFLLFEVETLDLPSSFVKLIDVAAVVLFIK